MILLIAKVLLGIFAGYVFLRWIGIVVNTLLVIMVGLLLITLIVIGVIA